MTGSFWEYFLFYGLAGFYIAWLECVCNLVQELYFASSPGVWHEIRPCVHGDLRSQNWFPYSYFRWRKGGYFRFRVLANHLDPFFFIHPVRRFLRTTIFPYTHFFIHPVTECKHLLAFILTRICYFGREELTYIPNSSSNGQSVAVC